MDAPYARNTRSPATALARRSTGAISPQEPIAAYTALTLLSNELTRLGLRVQTSGTMLWARPILDTHQASKDPPLRSHQTVVLAHNPADRHRLWWWLPQSRPPGQPPDLQPCARATDIRSTAQTINRILTTREHS